MKNWNMVAFWRVIREGESNQSEDAYRILYGGRLMPVPPWQHPYYGHTTVEVGHSTAFGAYQFLGTSYKEAASALGIGNNAAPAMQDLCAVWTIDVKRHALAEVLAGDPLAACQKLTQEWISFPRLGADRILRVYQAYGGRRGPITEGDSMAKKLKPHSDQAVARAAEGFSPIIEHTAAFPARPTYEDAIGEDGMVCIQYDTMGMKVGNKLGFSVAPYPVPPNQGQPRVASISVKKGDFSIYSRSGYDQAIEGMIVHSVDADGNPVPVPPGWIPQTYVPIVEGTKVWINFANQDHVTDGNARLQVNHS